MSKKNGKKSIIGLLYFIVPVLLVLLFKYVTNDKEAHYNALNNFVENNYNNAEMKIPEMVDYIFDVKPILSDRSYLCHGPDEGTGEAGFRLDTKDSAYAAIGKDLDRHTVIPGDTVAVWKYHWSIISAVVDIFSVFFVKLIWVR